MLHFRFGGGGTPLGSVLCLGAHCDDIEIGCGATLLRLIDENPGLAVHWVVFSSSPVRAGETHRAAELLLAGAAKKHIGIHDFRDGFFPYCGGEIKLCFERLKMEVRPDLVFTHYRDDLHQDHRTVAELTWNTFRDHLILEYEIPKYDGDFGVPGVFMTLPAPTCKRKIDILLDCYGSQRAKSWFSRELFMATLRLRGMEANSPTGLAEAYYCRKAVL
jgi:LmbE family N-acetylglucosaminyl deacetylase